jgi:hypothetical protein
VTDWFADPEIVPANLRMPGQRPLDGVFCAANVAVNAAVAADGSSDNAAIIKALNIECTTF